MCANQANFEFAEQVKLKSNNDLTWFTQSPHFECGKNKEDDGRSYHVATHFHGLQMQYLPNISDLPDGYCISDWAHPQHKLTLRSSMLGIVICQHCGTRRKHGLLWPREAYYQIGYRGHVLRRLTGKVRLSLALILGHHIETHRSITIGRF